ncbi:MAG: type II toxin-antitoxin system RelE/ParE family toxin [bacterium]
MYEISFTRSADSDYRDLPADLRNKVGTAVDGLSINPRPDGVQKMKVANPPFWRIRIGDYRIIFAIDDNKKEVVIARIRHRKDVYR